MTVAVELARQGFVVDLVEPAPGPFEVQRNCETRWIDPVQYDWPMDHWERRAFPWSRSYRYPRTHARAAIPFPLTSAYSDALVWYQWDNDLVYHLTQAYGR